MLSKVLASGDSRAPTCANVVGAGDGNRTRTMSLGIPQIRLSLEDRQGRHHRGSSR